jgi:hypothetical protein
MSCPAQAPLHWYSSPEGVPFRRVAHFAQVERLVRSYLLSCASAGATQRKRVLIHEQRQFHRPRGHGPCHSRRAVAGANAVELIGREAAKAKGLAAALGGGATTGTFGTAPAGDMVVLAVP